MGSFKLPFETTKGWETPAMVKRRRNFYLQNETIIPMILKDGQFITFY